MRAITFVSYASVFLCYVTFVETMFFTNSKDNDYPRIGKRPLPSSVYKTWLSENEQIEYLPYTYETRPERNTRGYTKGRLLRENNGYEDTEESDMAMVQLPEERKLYRLLMGYLESEDDLNF